MKEENRDIEFGRDLPFELPEEQWGEPVQVEKECPGVYYVAAKERDTMVTRELYAVMKLGLTAAAEKIPQILLTTLV